MFIDTHAHLTFGDDYENIDTILQRAQAAGVEKIVNICTDETSLQRGLELANTHSWIFNAGATTPHDVDNEGESHFPLFAKAAKEGKFVAIGETGLDYFYEHSDRNAQKTYLKKYLMLALECNLPVIFHCRDAFADLYEICDNHFIKNGVHGKGVMHCFTGDLQEGLQAIRRGWYLSLSGIITFKRSEMLRETIRQLPLDSLLIETDAPYLAPQSKRGKANEPSYIVETAQVLADVHGVSVEKIAEKTTENAHRFFCWPH